MNKIYGSAELRVFIKCRLAKRRSLSSFMASTIFLTYKKKKLLPFFIFCYITLGNSTFVILSCKHERALSKATYNENCVTKIKHCNLFIRCLNYILHRDSERWYIPLSLIIIISAFPPVLLPIISTLFRCCKIIFTRRRRTSKTRRKNRFILSMPVRKVVVYFRKKLWAR